MMEQQEQIDRLIDDISNSSFNDIRYRTEFLYDNQLAIVSNTSKVCAIVQYDEHTSEYNDDIGHEFGVYEMKVRKTEYEMKSYHLEDKDGAEVMATKDQRMQLGLEIKQVLIDLETTE